MAEWPFSKGTEGSGEEGIWLGAPGASTSVQRGAWGQLPAGVPPLGRPVQGALCQLMPGAEARSQRALHGTPGDLNYVS